MDPISMLPGGARCVRSKMGLFLRLWVTRHRYEQLRPFGRSSADALRFHLRQLQALWTRVVAYQQALALDVASFAPRGHFEAIYVVTGYVQREFESPRNTVLDSGGLWAEYTRNLALLTHDLNPFEFAEVCARCSGRIDELNGRFDERDQHNQRDNVIPMERTPYEVWRLDRAALF